MLKTSSVDSSSKSLIAQGKDCAPPLTAKLAPWMKNLIDQPGKLDSWFQAEGAPVHVVETAEFKRNIKAIQGALSERTVAGGIFFGRKANKLPWFVSAAQEEGIGVDTSSLEELRETLELGIKPKDIVITAICKETELIRLATAEGCLLIIDNLDELQLVKSIAQSLNKTARIGLRFSGFEINGRQIFSRFGFPVDEWPQLSAQIFQDNWLNVELLHAHLDRYDIEERACAARKLIELADNAKEKGHAISSLDLGGGILIRYLEKEEEWKTFLSSLKASVSGEQSSFTYRADGLGYHKVGEEVFGTADFYPEWNNLSKEKFVSAILDSKENGIPLYKEIIERGLKLFFEPGRALLDNTGITLAKVAFRKRDTLGNLLIGLSMNKTNLHPFRTEFCLDPIFINTENRDIISEGAFLVGHMLSEGDLILKRKLSINHLPLPGDIVLFPNTAGYFTHLIETQMHKKELPKNILLDSKTQEIKAIL